MNLNDLENLDLLLVAEGLMSEEDTQLTGKPGLSGVHQKRAMRIIDTRAALLIGLDIAKSLRTIATQSERRWSL